MTQSTSSDRLAELESITRDYARYAESAGGLSAVVGGALCLFSFGLGAALAPSAGLRGTLMAIPVIWLIIKHYAANRYYQRLGRVGETLDRGRLLMQRGLIAGVSALVVIIMIGVFLGLADVALPSTSLAAGLYLAVLIAIPLIAWRWLRTPIDLVVGTFLLCQAALAGAGRSYPLWSVALIFVPVAVLMIATGVRDHRHFRLLEQRIRTAVQAPVAES